MAERTGVATLKIQLKWVGRKVFRNIRSGMEKLRENAGKIGLSLAGLGAAFGKLAIEGGKFKAVENSFKSLAESQGQQADQMIASMRKATNETVSDMKLMQTANQAMMLGLPIERLDDMMKIAVSASQSTGESVEFMINSLVTGMGRGSKLMLDNLGIVFKLEDAYKEFAEANNIVGRELTEAEKKQAFMNKSMQTGLDNAKKAGPVVMNASMAYEQFKTAVANVSKELGTVLAPIFTTIAKSVTSIIKYFKNLSPTTKRVVTVVTTLGIALGALLAGLTGLAVILPALTVAWGMLGTVMAVVLSPIGLLVIGIAALAGGIYLIRESITDWADAIASVGKGIWEFISGPFKNLLNIFKAFKEGGFSAAWDALKGSVKGAGKEFDKAGESAGKAMDKIKAKFSGVKEEMADVKKKAKETGKALSDAMAGRAPGAAPGAPEKEAEKKKKEAAEPIPSAHVPDIDELYAKKEEEYAILEEFDLLHEERKMINDEMEQERIAAMDEFLNMSYAQRAQYLNKHLSTENASKMLQMSKEMNTIKANDKEKVRLLKEYYRMKDEEAKKDAQRNYQALKLEAGNQQSFDNMMMSQMHSKNATMRRISKAFAIRKAIEDTYAAALGGYKAMVGIPIIGPGLAVAAAAAATAFGMARVAQISAAQEGGVVMPQPGGRIIQAGEAGHAEAIIPLDDPEAQERMGGMGGVTVNINAGALMGSEDEAREFALRIDEELYKAKRAGETVSI